MQAVTAKNLVWANQEQTVFDCDVKFDTLEAEVPFSCSVTDTYSHSQDLWERGIAGEFGAIAAYVPPPVDEQGQATQPQPTVEGAQTL